jgi:hypothetical protein
MQGAAIKGFHASGAGNLFADFTLHRMSLVADGNWLVQHWRASTDDLPISAAGLSAAK